jgi:hypothetical protein
MSEMILRFLTGTASIGELSRKWPVKLSNRPCCIVSDSFGGKHIKYNKEFEYSQFGRGKSLEDRSQKTEVRRGKGKKAEVFNNVSYESFHCSIPEIYLHYQANCRVVVPSNHIRFP